LVLVPTGLAMLSLTTAANASVQLGVEPTMRGRVMALYLTCFMGGTPLGAPIVGWLAGVAGPRWGLIGGGLICLVATLALGAVFEGLNDFENLGALFRNAGAFGVDAVLLDPTCADSLYRRSVRVSMGHVLSVPFAVLPGEWPAELKTVREHGFTLLAMTPDDS